MSTISFKRAHGLTIAQHNAVDLFAAGLHDAAVAERVGVTHATVTRAHKSAQKRTPFARSSRPDQTPHEYTRTREDYTRCGLSLGCAPCRYWSQG